MDPTRNQPGREAPDPARSGADPNWVFQAIDMDEATFTGRGHIPAATALDVVCASSVTSR